MDRKSEENWNAILDKEKCSLCEVCANKCPTKALALNFRDETEELVFDFRLCDNCSGEPICQNACPEEAIFIEAADSKELSAPIVLINSAVARCASCGAVFAPGKKIETIRGKENVGERDEQRYCPDCRRKRMYERYTNVSPK